MLWVLLVLIMLSNFEHFANVTMFVAPTISCIFFQICLVSLRFPNDKISAEQSAKIAVLLRRRWWRGRLLPDVVDNVVNLSCGLQIEREGAYLLGYPRTYVFFCPSCADYRSFLKLSLYFCKVHRLRL